MGRGNITALTLLDLSAAVDTRDHKLLLNRLDKWFSIRGDALRRVRNYFLDMCQLISIQGKLSIPMSLLYGVPQGSVFEPLVFILYTTPLSQIITNFIFVKNHIWTVTHNLSRLMSLCQKVNVNVNYNICKAP